MLSFWAENRTSSCCALYVKAGFAYKEPYRMFSALDSKNQLPRIHSLVSEFEKYSYIDAASPLRAQFACFVQRSFNKCRWICFVLSPETGHVLCW
jgi:hypothetical protein